MRARDIVDAQGQHLVEDPALQAGDQVVADAGEQNRLPIIGQAPQQRDREHCAGGQPHRRLLSGHQHVVDHVAHQPGQRRGGNGHQHHAEHGAGIAAAMAAYGVCQQPPDQRQLPGIRSRISPRFSAVAGRHARWSTVFGRAGQYPRIGSGDNSGPSDRRPCGRSVNRTGPVILGSGRAA